MDAPLPNAAHRQFEVLVGDWRGTETMHPSQWDPAGGTAQGRTQVRMSPGGFYAVCEYEQSREDEVTYTGHGVYNIDPKTGQVEMHWFDDMGGGHDEFRGSFEGDKLVLVSKGPMGMFRSTNVYDGDRMTSKMELSEDGTDWKTLFEGKYTREPVTRPV